MTATELLDSLRSTPDTLQDWEKDLADFLAGWLSESDEIEVFTSGSTGIPKRISLQKRDMISSAAASLQFFGIEARHRLLLAMPVKYIAGKMMLVRAMVAGCSLAIRQPVSNPFAGLQEDFDFTAVTPHQMKQALLAGSGLDQVKKILIGGEPIQAPLLEEIKQLKSQCFASFGMTETITHFAVQSLNHPAEEYFRCLPGVTISTDEAGQLIVHSPWMKQAVHTADIVEILHQNRFKWLGRSDFVINTGGIKLHPEILEAKIQNIIHKKFIISQIPDSIFGEVPVLVIEGKEDDFPLQLEEINAKLDKFEKLKSVIFVDTLEATDSGKINRPAVKKQILQ